jgi:hypothetical protein
MEFDSTKPILSKVWAQLAMTSIVYRCIFCYHFCSIVGKHVYYWKYVNTSLIKFYFLMGSYREMGVKRESQFLIIPLYFENSDPLSNVLKNKSVFVSHALTQDVEGVFLCL